MKLTFLYVPVTDLATAIGFYRDTLGWSEAWREGDDTVAFEMPDSDVQAMVSTEPDPAGPMYLVDSVKAFIAANPGLTWRREPFEIPGGMVAGFEDPAGNVMYVLDQAAS